MAAATKALDMRLAPWHSVLKELRSPWENADQQLDVLESEECILWLTVRGRSSGPRALPDDVSRTCEALHLLALLARVDFDAWVLEAFAIWPEHSYRGWVEFKFKPFARQRSLRFGLQLKTSKPQDIDCLACLGAHNGANVYSSELYATSRAMLLQDSDLLPHNDDDHEWHVPVCLEHDYFQRSRTAAMETLLSTIAVVKNVQHTLRFHLEGDGDAPHTVVRPRFVIHEVRAASANDGFVTADDLKLLMQLVQLGVQVGNLCTLHLMCKIWEEQDVMKILVQALRYLTAQDDAADRASYGLRSVRISYKHSRNIMIALLSAVERSKYVRQVEIDLYEDDESDDESDADENDEDDGDRGGDWEWVTYHLFSRFASHKIQTLRMNLRNLRASEVDAIRDLLAEKNPLATLDGRHDECDREEPQLVAFRFCVIFPAEVKARLYKPEEFSHKTDKYMYTTPEPMTVRVISKPVEGEGPWWLVVLAGLGFAWVHEEDILSFVPWTDHDRALTQLAFPAVIVTDLSSDSRAASVDLLTLIGHGTSRLELHEYVGLETVDDWTGSVLRACPQLEEFLLLAAAMESLHAFVTAAEAGHDRLRRVKVQYIQATEPAHVDKFFAALCDPLHPLTVHLQQLDLNFIIEDGAPLSEMEIVASAVRMLEQNRRLEHVQLGFCFVEDAASRKDAIELAFQSQLQAKVPIRIAPLDFESKLAFLSVVDIQSTRAAAIGRLDSAVFAGIFQFAAVARVRMLQVAVPVRE